MKITHHGYVALSEAEWEEYNACIRKHAEHIERVKESHRRHVDMMVWRALTCGAENENPPRSFGRDGRSVL